ncbi:hypothetical protein [Rhodococcus sp. UNC363MFTsu5.1]|uniref:hypothetical protein n=1 Tax=Rhodococcus sp. UNC363MFTsu5.1 TaxID=1449069 RepID=UPI00068DB795|nr:hypothetical protein [Rhodococcus sp. UNC363MFTsu5.1]
MDPIDLDSLLEPWNRALGKDRTAYRHHVERVLRLCTTLAGGELPDPVAFGVAAVYHDLGIWSDGTFDYLDPSATRAVGWLREHGHADKTELVTTLIQQHHKVTSAGAARDAVEIFRRADWIDVTLGLRNFGVPRGHYRELLREFPDAGFHRRLLELGGKRALTKPWSPLPMFRW